MKGSKRVIAQAKVASLTDGIQMLSLFHVEAVKRQILKLVLFLQLWHSWLLVPESLRKEAK